MATPITRFSLTEVKIIVLLKTGKQLIWLHQLLADIEEHIQRNKNL